MVPAFFMTFMTSPDLQTITRTVAAVRPDVEIWDVQVVKGENLVRVLIEHPDGVDADLCAEVANVLSDVRDHGGLEVSSPGIERPLIRTTHYERALGETVQSVSRNHRGAPQPPRPPHGSRRHIAATRARRRRRARRAAGGSREVEHRLESGDAMSKDILEAVYELERQKSIDAEVLLVALEDALKAAYKKTPEAARHVRVEIDRKPVR